MKNQEFYGSLKVELDNNALCARLRFIPDKNGGKHNIDTLRQFLQSENIIHGINDVALKDAAEEFFDAMEETLSDPVAEGEPPNSGDGDVYEFSPMKYSPELESLAAKIYSLNKAPLIYDVVKTKEKKDRRVREKGLFKGGKEKIIVVEELVEKKIRVEVSSRVQSVGYFRKDELICRITSSEGMKAAGRDVHGNELKPLPVSSEKYLWGRNIRIEKNEFFAEQSGFVRQGENWLDLVPFAVHDWNVRLSDNRSDCFLDIRAGHKAAPHPSLSSVKEAADKAGCPMDNLLEDEEIVKIIQKGCLSGGAQTACLTRDLDGEFNIEINSLATEARLHLKKGSGKGRALNLQEIWTALKALKIKDFEDERIKREILDFNSSDQLEISILLARGDDPERGGDRELVVDAEYLDEEMKQYILERMEHLKKEPESFGEFPKESIEKMALVKKGSPVFHLAAQKEGKKGKDIYGNTIHGIEGNDPLVRLYENIIVREGKAISSIDGILDYSSRDSVFSLRIRKHADARVLVTISENSMSATLTVMPPEGSGCLPTKETLKRALEEKGVIKGISDEALNSILERTGREELVSDQIAAQGCIPCQGGDALQFLLDIQEGKSHSLTVAEGDVIAKIIPRDEKSPLGYDVRGESFFSDPGMELTIDEHIRAADEEGEKTLIAGIRGILCLEKNRLFIKSRQLIQGDLSRSSGNVQFPGTIEILGSVLSGIYVKAGNDLKIRDVVEAALLSSEGSILIGKGVKGDRKAVLRANRNISLGFAENATLMSNGNISYKKALMNCQIKCNGKIRSEDSNARIIGGKIKTKNGLTAESIGSERGASTTISFGQDYLVEDQINVMTREIEQIGKHLETLEDLMKTAEHKRQQKKLLALRKKKLEYLKLHEKKIVKNFLMKDTFELHFESEIRVSGMIYPGTQFESHGRTLEIKEKLTGVSVFFNSDSGKIMIKQN